MIKTTPHNRICLARIVYAHANQNMSMLISADWLRVADSQTLLEEKNLDFDLIDFIFFTHGSPSVGITDLQGAMLRTYND